MSESVDDTSKIDKHAWRRKPRKFAPKSRLGCKTCKIRRVKCGLERPSCYRCSSTGRKCDGYGDPPEVVSIDGSSTGSSNSSDSGDSLGRLVTHKRNQWLAQVSDPVRQSVGPLTVLSCTGPTQSLAMCFFEYVSIKHLTEFRPSETWNKSLMLYAQTVPAVQYAATALALVHRDHLDCGVTDRVYQLQASKGRSSFDAPLFYYNRAIQLLMDQQGSTETETPAITLLVCYLFMCFDLLAGNYIQATNHLRGGVELAQNFKQTKRKKGIPHDDDDNAASHGLISQVIEQVERLDMQSVIFLIDWSPAITRDGLLSPIPAPEDAFASLDQAADHLQILVARVMRHRNMALFPSEQMADSSDDVKFVLGTQLERWQRLFRRSQRQLNWPQPNPDSHPSLPLLRLQYEITKLLLETQSKDAEMGYDSFLSRFRQAMVLARQVAVIHHRNSDSKPTFTPEIGFLPVLWIIGAKCRDPEVRSEVLGLMRKQPMREAVWDSTITAVVLKRLIKIEEEGAGLEHLGGYCMQEIPEHRRIENLDWVHYPGAEPLLSLSYTYSGSEEPLYESIPL
ncbi:sugar transporter [Sarocladium implicatum]|nr:sugar transporter [Sarocladium implicatum]